MGENNNSFKNKSYILGLIGSITGVLGLLLSIISLYMHHQLTINENQKESIKLTNQAWDYFGGTEGKPSRGTAIVHGDVKRDKRNLEIVRRKINEALRLDPKNVRAITIKGIYLECKGKINESISVYQEAIKLDPNYQNAYINLGDAQQKNGNRSSARLAYQKAIELDEEDIVAINNLGLLNLKEGRYVDAKRLYQQAIAIDPERPELYVNLGLATRFDGDLMKAIDIYDGAIQKFPENGLLYFCKSLALSEIGMKDKSEKAKEKARKLGWNLNSCGYDN